MPKSSVTPFTYYTFRYDYKCLDLLSRIKAYIIKTFPKYAIFDEVSTEVEKAHIQGKLGIALSLVQTRKLLRAEFPDVFVKSNYSMSPVDNDDKYDSYICKDGIVFCNNIFDDEFIQASVTLRSENKKSFALKKEKKSSVTFTQNLSIDFCRLFPDDVMTIQHHEYKPDDYQKTAYRSSCENLLNYILKRLGVVAKVFDDNVLQRMYNGCKNYIIQLDAEASRVSHKSYTNRINL